LAIVVKIKSFQPRCFMESQVLYLAKLYTIMRFVQKDIFQKNPLSGLFWSWTAKKYKPLQEYHMELGWTITGVGMLVVFSFLVLIVIVMNIMSSVVLKYFPEKEVPVKQNKGKMDNLAEIAAAVAAVQAYSKSS
jgi:oxaloacetate decarboxylase gamma subunit